MSPSMYDVLQKISVVDDLQQAETVSAEIINHYVLGVDCEWNQGSKISMVQLATSSDVYLFRINKFADKQLPRGLLEILENSDIIKVGVNIENDALKLRKQYQCVMKGWVDLRNLVVTKEAYGKVLLQKLQKFEEELDLLYPEHNDDELLNLDCKRGKKAKRFNWNPRLGLATLTEDCLGLYLQKNSTARWQDDWEAEELSQLQIEYAAADGAAALEILFSLIMEKDLGTRSSIKQLKDFCVGSMDLKTCITNFCGRVVERKVQQKSLVKQCYSLITAIDKEFDLTDYMTKPAQLNKNKNKQPSKKAKLLDGTNEQPLLKVHKTVRKTPLYENCKLYAPDGTLLCTCNKSKINWYLNNNLAEPVPQAEGDPPAAKLLFEPSGKPVDGSDFYCQDKVNECCCCSQTEDLVRKNVIPKEYRKHLPSEFKDRQSHDVVLLCVQCHCSSNIFDNIMRDELANQHGVPINYKNKFVVVNRTKSGVRAAAKALTATNNKIPEERKVVLKQKISDYLGHEPTAEEIMELKYMEVNETKYVGTIPDHGSEVVKRVIEQGTVEEFIVRWRNFFLSSMKPQFLPKGWCVDHKTRDKSKEEAKEGGKDVQLEEMKGREAEGEQIELTGGLAEEEDFEGGSCIEQQRASTDEEPPANEQNDDPKSESMCVN
ncbi:hypothetical protein ACHWQZ_G008549 [Mnemiopsis leidyi]